MSMKPFVRIIGCMILAFTLSPAAFAGGNSSGGGNPKGVDAGALKLLIMGGGLKRDMVNYLGSIQVDKIQDPKVKALLTNMMTGDTLKNDIMTPNNFAPATRAHPCVDEYNNNVPASTTIGLIGGKICFDIDKLAAAYKNLSEEEATIHLAGLAFHEFTHHFQKPTSDPNLIMQNEAAANMIGGYVLLTAKFLLVPVLQWAPDDGSSQFQRIIKLDQELRAEELAYLRPPSSDYRDYPSYKHQPDRGLIRILNREVYDGKMTIAGWEYDFSTKQYGYEYGGDMLRVRDYLETGLAGCNFGYFVSLGSIPIEDVTTNSPALQFLLNFIPANHNEPAIRKEQAQAQNGLNVNGFHYQSDLSDDIEAGQTFALRSIEYDSSDVLVVFRIVRVENDGSLVIAWRKIKSFPVSSCYPLSKQ